MEQRVLIHLKIDDEVFEFHDRCIKFFFEKKVSGFVKCPPGVPGESKEITLSI